MKQLIKIQATINLIEENTLELKYHSSFDYIDSQTLDVDTFCWPQASTYKNIFDKMPNIAVYMESNSKLRFLELKEEVEE